MNPLHEWLAQAAPGHSWLQQGGMNHDGLCFTPYALHAGARRAFHIETEDWPAETWDRLLDACRPHEDLLTTLRQDAHEGGQLATRVPLVDIACVVQLFHQRDPYQVLHNIARMARHHLVVASCVLPPDADGLHPGEQVAGSALDDPRLQAARRVLERRGLDIAQFHIPPHGFDAQGRPHWDGMWHWFQTEPALIRMIEGQGWRVTQRHAVWEDIGLVLVADRA